MLPQIRCDSIGLKVRQALLQQSIGQGDGARDDDAVLFIADTIPARRLGGVGRKDAMRADKVRFLCPRERRRVEVAEEDVHEEGAVDGEVFDSDVGAVFTVVFLREVEGLVYSSDQLEAVADGCAAWVYKKKGGVLISLLLEKEGKDIKKNLPVQAPGILRIIWFASISALSGTSG